MSSTLLNDFKRSYLKQIYLTHETLTGTTTPGSRGSYNNERAHHSVQSSKTEGSTPDKILCHL